MTEFKKSTARRTGRSVQISVADASEESTSKHTSVAMGTLNQHVGYFTRRFQVWIFKDFIRTLAPMNIRPAQYSVLTLIAFNPGHSQADIGEALGIDRARMARMLDKLEKCRFIQRLPSTQDRRLHRLFLTKEGHGNLERIHSLAAEHEARVAKIIGSRRRTALIKLLKNFEACE